MVKYAILVGLLITLTVSGLQCSLGCVSPSPPPPTHPPPAHPLEMIDVTDKPWYAPGETVEVSFSWKNVGSEPVTVKPFPMVVEIWDPYDSVIRLYPGGSEERTLKLGETLSYTLTWDQLDNSGLMVEPGYYFLNVEYEAIVNSGTHHTGYETLRILIQSPQGAPEVQ